MHLANFILIPCNGDEIQQMNVATHIEATELSNSVLTHYGMLFQIFMHKMKPLNDVI